MLTLLIDMDGPTAGLPEVWYPAYNRDWSTCPEEDLTPEKITRWGIHDLVKPECGLKIYDYLKKPGIYGNAPPVPGAIEALRYLNRKHIVYMATHVLKGPGYLEKAEWVDRYLPFIGHDRIWMGKDKYMLRGDMLLDDGPENLIKFPGVTICWDELYNQHVIPNYRLVGSPEARWEEVIYVVDRYAMLKKLGCTRAPD